MELPPVWRSTSARPAPVAAQARPHDVRSSKMISKTPFTDFSIDAIIGESSSSPASTPSRPAGGRPKKFECPQCPVRLSNTGQFRGHMRIHTGERPFRCDQPFCDKAFTRNEELTRHKRIHTGQRPYECQLCQKRFGRKDHLKKHMRTHEKIQSEGEQSYPQPLNLTEARRLECCR